MHFLVIISLEPELFLVYISLIIIVFNGVFVLVIVVVEENFDFYLTEVFVSVSKNHYWPDARRAGRPVRLLFVQLVKRMRARAPVRHRSTRIRSLDDNFD